MDKKLTLKISLQLGRAQEISTVLTAPFFFSGLILQSMDQFSVIFPDNFLHNTYLPILLNLL
jgi:hypothetical protein